MKHKILDMVYIIFHIKIIWCEYGSLTNLCFTKLLKD